MYLDIFMLMNGRGKRDDKKRKKKSVQLHFATHVTLANLDSLIIDDFQITVGVKSRFLEID